MANTILLKGRGVRLEAPCAETITPGQLVDQNSSGQLIKQVTASIGALKAFAVENDLIGKEIGDNYVANDYGQAEIMKSGDEVLAFIVASGAAVVIGDKLESAGGGSLKKYSSGVMLAQAIEAVDNSGGGTDARIKVRIL